MGGYRLIGLDQAGTQARCSNERQHCVFFSSIGEADFYWLYARFVRVRRVGAGGVTLFVSDGVDDAVHRFDASPGPANGTAISPNISLLSVTGVATAANGDVYAVSQNTPQVYRYNSMTGVKSAGRS